MSRGSIDQPLAKLGRAAYHYRVVKFDVFGGHDRQAWPVTLERHRDGLEYRLRAPKIEPLPTDLPLIFGDAYFNLRAALDYLVFQLHLRHYRGNLPAKIVKSSAFPIYNQQPLAKGGALLDTCNWKEIGTLGKHERTALEWLQPDKGRGSGLTKQIREALSDLSSLNNIDKHQELHVTQRIVQAVPIPDFPPEFGFQQHPAFGIPLESGAYVDTWTFAKAPPPEYLNMNFSVRTAVQIEPIIGRLEEPFHLGGSILAVEAVVKRFSRLFPPPVEPLNLSWVRMNTQLALASPRPLDS
jgi:hypothetical protein